MHNLNYKGKLKVLAQDTSNIGVLMDFSHCNLDTFYIKVANCKAICCYKTIGKVEKIILIEQFFM